MNLPKLTQVRRTSPILLPLTLLLAVTSIGQAEDAVQITGSVTPGPVATPTWNVGTGKLYVGYSGAGTLKISGDGIVSSDESSIGWSIGTTGVATVSGGSWTNTYNLWVGRGGNGTLEISGGIVTNSTGFIGDGPSTGLATVSGGSWTNSETLMVGRGGTGTLEISGTGAVSSGDGVIGVELYSLGVATVSGGSWSNSGLLYIGGYGTGTLEISGTGTVSATSVNLSFGLDSESTLNLFGGTLSTGQVSEGSGSLGGNVTFNGGTLRLTADQASLFAGFEAGDVTLTDAGGTGAGGTIDTQAFSVTTAAALSGAGGLAKEGTGILTLSGANTYTGQTTIADGRLAVNGSTSADSAVGVSSGGTLAGSGTVGGSATISSGGTLAPGNSPGVLTVTGTTAFASGSIFEWELDTAQSNPETNRGVAYDGVNTSTVSGENAIFKIMLTGTQDFADTFWNQTRVWTDIFKTANDGDILSNWAGVFGGGFQYAYNGQTVAPTSAGSFAVSGNSLTWSAVPEPSNLLAGMLAASALLRRRRQG
jgi:autotransporter-associated beta strand protein/T5SS/PEP-CTERM-associated repeat protein